MKRTFILLMLTTMLGLVSCKKETIVQDTPNRTYNFTIRPSDWVLNSGGFNYTFTQKLAAIDAVTLDDEGVLVYINHPSVAGNFIQLPFVYDTKAYSYALFNGGISLDIQSADAQATAPIRPTQNILVKVVIVPSQYNPNNN